jgi:hypothetical protein
VPGFFFLYFIRLRGVSIWCWGGYILLIHEAGTTLDPNNRNNAAYSESLTYSEQIVLDVLIRHKAPVDDLRKISKICRLTEMQTGVALQLLTHKKLIPPQ